MSDEGQRDQNKKIKNITATGKPVSKDSNVSKNIDQNLKKFDGENTIPTSTKPKINPPKITFKKEVNIDKDVPKIEKNTRTSNSNKTLAEDVQSTDKFIDKKPSVSFQKDNPGNKKTNTKKDGTINTSIENTDSAQKLVLGFLGFGAILMLVFYAVIFWATLSGNVSNPVLETLGIEAAGLKSLLITMTVGIFGFISLVFFVLTLIFLFRGVMANKHDFNKKRLLIRAALNFFLFILVVGLWVFLYWFISNLQVGPTVEVKKMLIKTNPEIVIDLDSPIRVEFDLSEGLKEIAKPELIRQVNWDFDGDGIFDASGPKVTHRFLDKGLNNGIYNVKATILYFSEKKGEVLTGETERQVIINNESVLAILTPTPSSGVFPLTVEFSALESKDPDGSIVWYEWDLDGDGIFEERREDPIIHKTFDTIGEHKVALRITGTNTDDFDVAEAIITVKNPEGTLRGDINTEGISEGNAPLKILFDGSNSFVKEGKIVRYEWLVDNEKEAFVGRKMQRIFRTPGEHIVSLIVENDIGEKHETKKIITVLEDETPSRVLIRTTPPKLKDQEFLRGIVPFEVTFDSNLSQVKNAFEWHWDFQDDGIIDEFAQVAQHTFRKPGIYDVRLNILDANEETHTALQRVIVEKSGTLARIKALPSAGEVPLSIKFDGSGSSTDNGTIVDYIWEFPGINPIHYGAKISYLFKQIGNFPVKLTILTSTGQQSSTTTIISAREPQMKAEFNYNPKVGNAPLTVTVSPVISTGIVREYLWNFGDGNVQKQLGLRPIEHVYKRPGKYPIKLRLTNENGVISEVEKIVEVRPRR